MFFKCNKFCLILKIRFDFFIKTQKNGFLFCYSEFFLYNKSMRIIAGKFKGKKLAEFDLPSTRPTSDKIREALFDKIQFQIVGARFLDLFAGTGACGIEALSRGAREGFFVDENKDATKIILKNLQSIEMQNATVLNADYNFAINQFAKSKLLFDVVFLDPPYATNFAEKAIVLLTKKGLVNKNTLFVWEHDKSKLSIVKNAFDENISTRKYGDKFLTYFKVDNIININKIA